MTDIKKGLAGVVADETAVSKVNPETNSLLYRGYPVQELASTQSFEAVAYLLWHGELPTASELAELRDGASESRAGPRSKRRSIAATGFAPDGRGAHCGQRDRRYRDRGNQQTRPMLFYSGGEPRVLKLFAALPAIVSYGQRRRRGQEIVEPRMTSITRRTSCG